VLIKIAFSVFASETRCLLKPDLFLKDQPVMTETRSLHNRLRS